MKQANEMMRATVKAAAAAAVLLACGNAMAASTWSVNLGGCTDVNAATYEFDCNGTGVDSTAAAIGTADYAVGTQFAAVDLDLYGGGVGVTSSPTDVNNPQHAIDNNNYVDGVLLHFDSSVILNEVTLGWRFSDWDFSVFAYTGGDPASIDPATLKLGTQLNGGAAGSWSLVASYASADGCNPSACGNLAAAIGNTSTSSTWWIVSAYANAYGTGSKVGPGGLDQGDDYFKLLAVAGIMPSSGGGSAPEPGSLALVGVALLGAWGGRKKLAPRS